MITESFLEYGVAIFAIAGMIYLVKKFLCFAKRQEENCNLLIKNHMHESAEANKKLEQSHLQLSMTIRELLSFLKKSNEK